MMYGIKTLKGGKELNSQHRKPYHLVEHNKFKTLFLDAKENWKKITN
jgi:hypothetical protein